MEKRNLQKLRVVFVVSPLKQHRCNILPRLADSNGFIVAKLKRDLKYRGYVYFEPVCPNVIYRAVNYLKHIINSMRIFPLQKASQAKK